MSVADIILYVREGMVDPLPVGGPDVLVLMGGGEEIDWGPGDVEAYDE